MRSSLPYYATALALGINRTNERDSYLLFVSTSQIEVNDTVLLLLARPKGDRESE